jgi:hypothetical protein
VLSSLASLKKTFNEEKIAPPPAPARKINPKKPDGSSSDNFRVSMEAGLSWLDWMTLAEMR